MEVLQDGVYARLASLSSCAASLVLRVLSFQDVLS